MRRGWDSNPRLALAAKTRARKTINIKTRFRSFLMDILFSATHTL